MKRNVYISFDIPSVHPIGKLNLKAHKGTDSSLNFYLIFIFRWDLYNEDITIKLTHFLCISPLYRDLTVLYSKTLINCLFITHLFF